MNLIFFGLIFISVGFAECAHGSRRTKNELSPDSLAPHKDPVKMISQNENTDKASDLSQPTLPSTGTFNEAISSTNNSNQLNATRRDDNSTFISNNFTTRADQVPSKNISVNIFAQRVSQNIFHNPPEVIFPSDTDEPPAKLHHIRTLMWSPISVYHSLLPLYYAAAGKTKKELQQLLLAHVDQQSNLVTDINDNANISALFNFTDLNNVISGSGETLSSATGIFTRNDLRLNPEYVHIVQKELKNTDVKTIDFNNPSTALKSINKWVNNNTQGLINDAVDETQIYPNIYMMIVNCVRFKAFWKTRFNSKQTKISNFYGVNGVQKVQMMKQIGTHKFAKFPIIYSSDYEEQPGYNKGSDVSFSVVEIPYADENFASLFILPDTTDKLQSTLDFVGKVGVEKIRQMLHLADVEILMPKFKINSNVNIEKALIENGLTTLFDPLTANLAKFIATNDIQNKTIHGEEGDSDIPRITDFLSQPYLSSIIHRTIFETSEEGTTAAALTALSIVPLSALSQDLAYRFNLNRPFIVLLIKNDSTIVFQGVIADLVGQDANVAGVFHKNAVDEKSSNSSPIGNSFLYPSDSESKAESNKLVDSNGEDSRSNSFVSKESLPQDQPTAEPQITDTEDRSWWVPSKIPAYLLPMNETFQNSSNATVDTSISNDTHSEIPEQVEQTPQPPIRIKVPYEYIQFTKYQQPEPKDPTGIRFPATYPLIRNKVNIKPRFENHHEKRTLNQWMYVN